MYGKLTHGKFTEGVPDASKSIDKQKMEMMLKGYLPIIEIAPPGLGNTCKYIRKGNNLIQVWTYSKEQHIQDLKNKLAETDYIVIKIAEGAATAEEYADVIAQRQEWRTLINELMAQE